MKNPHEFDSSLLVFWVADITRSSRAANIATTTLTRVEHQDARKRRVWTVEDDPLAATRYLIENVEEYLEPATLSRARPGPAGTSYHPFSPSELGSFIALYQGAYHLREARQRR